MQNVDLIVIGSGPGGYRAAVLAALRGLRVAIVERGEWGGTCLNRGCVPKKAWYHSSRAIAASREYSKRGVRGALSGDLAQAWLHQRAVVAQVRASYLDYLKRLRVTCLAGSARFVEAGVVSIDGERLTAPHIIIATGSTPHVPPALPRAPGRVLTTDDLFDTEAPRGRRVAVIGSGVIGTEFAFILTLLGCEVAWLTQQLPLARSAYSEAARTALTDRLAMHGIRARSASRATHARVAADGVHVGLPDGSEVRVDWVLLGAGRMPNTDGLDLAAAGIRTTAEGFIVTDALRRTTAPGCYAIGDVANAAMTSNHALADAAIAVDAILAPGSTAARSEVPQVVYSALELARIGMNQDEAEAQGYEPAIGFAAFEASPAAAAEGDTEGYVRIIADMEDGRLLGAEMVGTAAGELIHLVGIEFGAPEALRRIAGVNYNHPARAEEIRDAIETLASKWGLARRVFA